MRGKHPQHPEADRKSEVRARFDRARKDTVSVRTAAMAVGVPVSTIYDWKRRYSEQGYSGLIARSRRPHRVRQSQLSPEVVTRFLELRRAHPCEGARKIAVYLHREGYAISFSSADRLCQRLRKRRLIGPARQWLTKPRRMRTHPRQGKAPPATYPGAVVGVDALYWRLPNGRIIYFITYIDHYTRIKYIYVASSLTSHSAVLGLREAQQFFSFPIHAVRTDGGSEFAGEFATVCATTGTPHSPNTPIQYVTQPNAPTQNAIAERAQAIIRQEAAFYISEEARNIAEIRESVMVWLIHYRTVRPHTALGYLTPQQMLDTYNQSHHTPP